MTINDKIKDEILQYDIIREAAKLSAYHLEKLIKINILQVTEQAKFTYSASIKAFEKQTETIEKQGT